MGPFEYLLTFAAVILGLAVSDIAMSLHRLMDAGRRVRWDWLAPLAAVVAFLKIVTQWWSWFGAASLAGKLTFEMFLGVLVGAVLLFLLAATSLPDAEREGEIDLRAYYARVARRYWLLFAGHWALGAVVSVWAQMQLEGARFAWSPVYLIAPAALGLAFVRIRWLHAICLAALAVLYVVQFGGRGLGA